MIEFKTKKKFGKPIYLYPTPSEDELILSDNYNRVLIQSDQLPKLIESLTNYLVQINSKIK